MPVDICDMKDGGEHGFRAHHVVDGKLGEFTKSRASLPQRPYLAWIKFLDHETSWRINAHRYRRDGLFSFECGESNTAGGICSQIRDAVATPRVTALDQVTGAAAATFRVC